MVLDLQSGTGWSVGLTALPLIAATVAWTIGSVAAAPLHLDPNRQLVIGHVGVVLGCAVMALPVAGGAAVAAGITLAGFGMGVQSPAAFIAIAPDGDPRAAAAVPLARNLGAGVGVAIAGVVITAVAGSVAPDGGAGRRRRPRTPLRRADGVPARGGAVCRGAAARAPHPLSSRAAPPIRG